MLFPPFFKNLTSKMTHILSIFLKLTSMTFSERLDHQFNMQSYTVRVSYSPKGGGPYWKNNLVPRAFSHFTREKFWERGCWEKMPLKLQTSRASEYRSVFTDRLIYIAISTKVVQKQRKNIRYDAERSSGNYPINFNKSSESIMPQPYGEDFEMAGSSQTTFRHCRVHFYDFFWTTFVETAVNIFRQA